MLLQVRQDFVVLVASEAALLANPVDFAVLAREVIVQLLAVLLISHNHALCWLLRLELVVTFDRNGASIQKVVLLPRHLPVLDFQIQSHVLRHVRLRHTLDGHRTRKRNL